MTIWVHGHITTHWITVTKVTYPERRMTLNSIAIVLLSKLSGMIRPSLMSIHFSWSDSSEANSKNQMRTQHDDMSGTSQLSSVSSNGSRMVTGFLNCNESWSEPVILSMGLAEISFPLNVLWGISCNYLQKKSTLEGSVISNNTFTLNFFFLITRRWSATLIQ